VSQWSGAPQQLATVLRDVVTPLVGIGLAIHEVLHGGTTEWGRIVLIGGMIGLPTFTFLDWRQSSTPAGPAGPPPPPALPAGSGTTGGPSTS
jgi:hypothetical protein